LISNWWFLTTCAVDKGFAKAGISHDWVLSCAVLCRAVICRAASCCAAQAIPGLSPVPWWGTLFPLAVVLLVNGVKEAFDDYWRHKSDEQVR
jgi:hypothetical protein